MLLVFAMKCCTKMPCPLPHNHCCLLSSPICLPYLLICSVHASSLHPLLQLAHHHLCYVDVYCVFFFFFLIYAAFLCDSILDRLCTYFYLTCVVILTICMRDYNSGMLAFIKFKCHVMCVYRFGIKYHTYCLCTLLLCWLDVSYPQHDSTEITLTTENFWSSSWNSIILLFLTLTLTRHTNLNTNP